jgi:hypothetical protein
METVLYDFPLSCRMFSNRKEVEIMYYYKSPIVPMYIKYDQLNKKYLLIINGIGYGHYLSPTQLLMTHFAMQLAALSWTN